MLNTQDPEEIIKTVKYIEPVLSGINREDISAPRCFEIESRLKEILDIPVFHDDQHGTAIVTLAALIDAFKVVNKKLSAGKITIFGAGAAGLAIAELLLKYGVGELMVLDLRGIICKSRKDSINTKKKLLKKQIGKISAAL